MQMTSYFRREGVSLTAVGLAFAGGALFILGFRAIVDTPKSTTTTSDITSICAAVQPLLNSFQNVGTRTQDNILHPPMYAPDKRIEQWVLRTNPPAK